MRRIEIGIARWIAGVGVCAALCVGLVGCGGEKDNQGADAAQDTGTVPDLDAPDPPDQREWSVETIADGGVGLLLDMEAKPGGGFGTAFYAARPKDDGVCEALMEDPPQRKLFPVYYVHGSPGSWTTETVYEPLIFNSPQTLDLEYDDSGTATLAAMSGDPLPDPPLGYCGVHDLAWMARQGEGNWQSETVVQESGEASNSETDEVSDFGYVVGVWGTLTYDGSTALMAYRDIHQGGRQSNDTSRADLEFARRTGGGGWEAIPVDWGRGAGPGAEIEVDGEGRIYIAYLLPNESRTKQQLGVWIARSTDGGDSWEKAHIYHEPTPSPPSMVVRDDGRIGVLFYNANRGFPQLLQLEDPAKFGDQDAWTTTDIGDGQYDEGTEPSLAVAPDGTLAATYRRCGRAAKSLGECKRSVDGVVYAYVEDGGWKREFVAGGDDVFCGHATALDFSEDGTPTVAFRCSTRVDGDVGSAVQIAQPK